MKLKRVLIANRGEIALRIVRTVRALGLETVVAYSDADHNSLPVRQADFGVRIGAAAPASSYLSIEAILAAAKTSGADAIHPGYGFLAERRDFAQAVEAAGIAYLGPTPRNVAQLGDKAAARRALMEAGVRPVPGVALAGLSPGQTLEAVEGVGFPVVLKATAGGGGRGIRIVRRPKDFREALETAISEGRAAFGSSDMVVERYLENARHVEVQVIGDGAGGVQLFHERDCSTQRRLQKVIEETPCSLLSSGQRRALLEAVGRAVSQLGYRSAGTLEFLLSEDGELFFLEMNTRIQVEHPLSEVTTGVDLVERQIAIEEGERLPPWRSVEDNVIAPRGAAMEFRVTAEDVGNGFLPVSGRVTAVHLPSGPGVRIDTAVEQGTEITPHYDSLLAKVIAWGQSRAAAMARLEGALEEIRLDGVLTTVPLGLAILRDAAFRADRHHCQYLEERLRDGSLFPGKIPESKLAAAAAAAAWLRRQQGRTRPSLAAPAAPRESEWRRQGRWGDDA